MSFPSRPFLPRIAACLANWPVDGYSDCIVAHGHFGTGRGDQCLDPIISGARIAVRARNTDSRGNFSCLRADRIKATNSSFVVFRYAFGRGHIRRAITVELSKLVVDSGLLTCQPSSHKNSVVSSYETRGSSYLGAHL